MTREVVVLSAARSAVGSFRRFAVRHGAVRTGRHRDEGRHRPFRRRSQIRSATSTVGNCIPTESRFAYVPRVASIQAGLPTESVAMQVNRLCSSGLQGHRDHGADDHARRCRLSASAAASKSCRAAPT